MDAALDFDWCMQAEKYLDVSLSHILSEPGITVPRRVKKSYDWVAAQAELIRDLDDRALEEKVLAKGHLWQFARLHQMIRSGLIKNFGFQIDSDSGRLCIFVEPLSPRRLLALKVPGVVPAKKSLVQ